MLGAELQRVERVTWNVIQYGVTWRVWSDAFHVTRVLATAIVWTTYNGNFDCAPVSSVAFVTQERLIQAVPMPQLVSCRSMLDDNKVRLKAESSSCEAKIVRIGAESFKIFPSRPDKGTNGLSFFALEGKIEQWIRISAKKRPRGPGLSK